jgi:hypothetical protein
MIIRKTKKKYHLNHSEIITLTPKEACEDYSIFDLKSTNGRNAQIVARDYEDLREKITCYTMSYIRYNGEIFNSPHEADFSGSFLMDEEKIKQLYEKLSEITDIYTLNEESVKCEKCYSNFTDFNACVYHYMKHKKEETSNVYIHDQ